MSRQGLYVVGTSHAVAPSSFREALSMCHERARKFLSEMQTALPEAREAAILSTCTRTEIYLVASDRSVAERVRARLAGRAEGRAHDPERHIYVHEGDDAIRHLFRVASGLDSIVLGEGQILSQVKEARRLAWSHGTCGPVLCKLLDDAIRCGKRVRTETRLSRGSVSVASTAAEIVQRELHGLEERTVLVLGTGETGTVAARMLAKMGPRSLLLVNRTRRTAEALAREVGGEAESMRDLADVLVRCDAAICATASAEPVLGPDLIARVQRARGDRPLLLVDIANPRDVDPTVGAVPGVVVRDLDHMRDRVDANLARRQAEIEPAERIVAEEIARFRDWLETRSVVPLLRALRETFQEIGNDVLEAELRRFGEEHREPMSRFARSLLNRLLHAPTVQLKGLDLSADTDLLKIRLVEELFELEERSRGSGSRDGSTGPSSNGDAPPGRAAGPEGGDAEGLRARLTA